VKICLSSARFFGRCSFRLLSFFSEGGDCPSPPYSEISEHGGKAQFFSCTISLRTPQFLQNLKASVTSSSFLLGQEKTLFERGDLLGSLCRLFTDNLRTGRFLLAGPFYSLSLLSRCCIEPAQLSHLSCQDNGLFAASPHLLLTLFQLSIVSNPCLPSCRPPFLSIDRR